MRECDAFCQYLRGQLLVMLVMACSTAWGSRCSLRPCRAWVFTGLAMFIPYVGFGWHLLALLAGVLQLRAGTAPSQCSSSTHGQMIEGFYLTPASWASASA